MTRQTNNEDDMWLDALAGRPHDGADPKINTEAERVRKILQKQSTELEAFLPNSSASDFQEFYRRLEKEQLIPTRQSFAKKYKTVIDKIKVVIAFILGMIVMAMMPTQIATRGGADNLLSQVRMQSLDSVDTKIVLQDENLHVIIDSAVAAGLHVSVAASEKGEIVTLKGFKAMDADQVAIKALIGMPNQTHGNVQVILQSR